MISARVEEMLHPRLPTWAPHNIVLLGGKSPNLRLITFTNLPIVHLSHTIIARGRAGILGPHGLSSLEDIYMVIGYEGTKRYMALVVNAPSRLDILVRGTAIEAENRDPLVNAGFMEELRVGFYEVATSEWQRLDWHLKQSAGH
jgi:hypothetical protein